MESAGDVHEVLAWRQSRLDGYGGRPWSYLENNGAATKALPTFSSSVDGALVGWTDPSVPNDFIATTSTGTTP